MNKMIQATKGTGKVTVAIFTGILMPILLWVGLGIAFNQKLRVKKQVTETAPTIGEILAKPKAIIEK